MNFERSSEKKKAKRTSTSLPPPPKKSGFSNSLKVEGNCSREKEEKGGASAQPGERVGVKKSQGKKM